MVNSVKSADISGSAAAVFGMTFAGRATKSYVRGASKMLAMMLLE